MPLYTYRCPNCNHKMEKIVKLAERETIHLECTQCSTKMNYEAFTSGDTGSNLYFRGKWFANTKGY